MRYFSSTPGQEAHESSSGVSCSSASNHGMNRCQRWLLYGRVLGRKRLIVTGQSGGGWIEPPHPPRLRLYLPSSSPLLCLRNPPHLAVPPTAHPAVSVCPRFTGPPPSLTPSPTQSLALTVTPPHAPCVRRTSPGLVFPLVKTSSVALQPGAAFMRARMRSARRRRRCRCSHPPGSGCASDAALLVWSYFKGRRLSDVSTECDLVDNSAEKVLLTAPYRVKCRVFNTRLTSQQQYGDVFSSSSVGFFVLPSWCPLG